MESSFYKQNREKLYATLENKTVVVVFSGKEIIKTADENMPFFASRNFVYLTGIDRKEFVLVAQKAYDRVQESIFILPKDAHLERWTGTRLSAQEVRELSGIEDVHSAEEFEKYFENIIKSGGFERVALDLYKNNSADRDSEEFTFCKKLRKQYPYLRVENILPQLRKQRTIKQPCEIDATRKAAVVTKAGIEAMMKASKPGMYEYQYRAQYDYALAQHGVMVPAFPSIISCGDNNFCIHYYDYRTMAKDGDMILNDVGARYDYMGNDVSRAFPCNGKFSDRQKLLYTCAYNTSEYMFSIIKPGMAMASVDQTARKYCYEQLKAIGLCSSYEDIGKYMWHGGAHHIGFDTHDIVDMTMPVSAGMIFCVDIGIYCEEWGIGFRLEDNCLVTETGCENLTAAIPRTIEEIENIMKK
ncbi:MAG: Xaa-Pro peptidase family protein [Oscillospiraceae bacterium]